MKPTQYTLPGKPHNFVDLVPGTVLFRAIHIKEGDELKTYFSDILGIPTEHGFCMSPVHNVFTFPLPYVGFGLYDWTADSPAWNKYNAFNVYILDHQGKFVNLILPSNEVRGSPKGYKRDDDVIRRCGTYGAACATGTKKEFLDYALWDNCITPEIQKNDNIIGSIAIAQADSIDKARGSSRDTPMGAYIGTLPAEDAAAISSNLYLMAEVKGLKARGIPEIVFHPRKPTAMFDWTKGTVERDYRHGGDKYNIIPYSAHKYELEGRRAIIRQAVKEIVQKNLNFKPFATITSKGYNYAGQERTIEIDVGEGETHAERKVAMESALREFLEKAQTDGFEQTGRLMYDIRTGFYVFEKFVSGVAVEGLRGSYKERLLIPLRTPNERAVATKYALLFKKPTLQDHFGKPHPAHRLTSAFMFQRPDSIRKVFTDLGVTMPNDIQTILQASEGSQSSSRFSQQTRTHHQQNRTQKSQGKKGGFTRIVGPTHKRSSTRRKSPLKFTETIRSPPYTKLIASTQSNQIPIVLPTDPEPLSAKANTIISTFMKVLGHSLAK
jgi:hypothetical protein